MNTLPYHGFECAVLENENLRLLVTLSAGPRIISLQYRGGENLLAEIPDVTASHPDGTLFHFYGGHRLWHAPEAMPRTYVPDDDPVETAAHPNGLTVTRPADPLTGMERSIRITLDPHLPQVRLEHRLVNRGAWPVELAPWAITQFRLGGTAVLPMQNGKVDEAGLLPNRQISLWPYSAVNDPRLVLGDDFILFKATARPPFKIGFFNPHGWLAYVVDGVTFRKRFEVQTGAVHPDNNSNAELYCGDRFVELETLGPLKLLAPGAETLHTEAWDVSNGPGVLPESAEKALRL